MPDPDDRVDTLRRAADALSGYAMSLPNSPWTAEENDYDTAAENGSIWEVDTHWVTAPREAPETSMIALAYGEYIAGYLARMSPWLLRGLAVLLNSVATEYEGMRRSALYLDVSDCQAAERLRRGPAGLNAAALVAEVFLGEFVFEDDDRKTTMSDLSYAANAMQKEVVLSWRKFVMQNQVPDCIADADISVIADHFTESMIIRARGLVLGEKLPSHTEIATGYATFESPATWWQHFKRQHGHRWWLRPLARRRPVRMAVERRSVTLTATWEHMATYPWADLTTAVPQSFGLGRPVRLVWVESLLTWRDSDDG